jgi:hypothetical protein
MSDPKNLFDAAVGRQVRQRLDRLQPDSARQWGSMSAAQAVAHCATSMEWAVGDRIPPRMFWAGILGRIIKSKVLADDAQFRRNSPTTPDLVVQGDRDLAAERSRLIALIDRFAAAGPGGCTSHSHSFFGPLTPEQWAILMYKHLDHHLRQFGE